MPVLTPPENFDYKNYLIEYRGYDESEIPEEISEEDKSRIYKSAVNDLFSETVSSLKGTGLKKNEILSEAVKIIDSKAPGGRQAIGIPEEKYDKDVILSNDSFISYIDNLGENVVEDVPVSNYVKDYANSIYNEYVDIERPYLSHVSKGEFIKSFTSKNNINKNVSIGEYLKQYKETPVDVPSENSTNVDKKSETNSDYGAFSYSLDNAEKLAGSGIKTIAEFLGSEGLEKLADDIISKQEKEIKEGNYKPKYTDGFIDTIKNQGLSGALGYITEKTIENSVQAGIAFGSVIASAVTAPVSATATAVIGILGLAGTSILGIGEVRQESEGKKVYNEDDAGRTILLGLAIGVIDKLSAGKAPIGLKNKLLKDLFTKQGIKSLSKGTLKSIVKEVPAEIAQEAISVADAWSKGAKYSKSELINRAIDTSLVAGALGGGSHVAVDVMEHLTPSSKSKSGSSKNTKRTGEFTSENGKTTFEGNDPVNSLNSIFEAARERGHVIPDGTIIKQNGNSIIASINGNDIKSTDINDLVEQINNIKANDIKVETEKKQLPFEIKLTNKSNIDEKSIIANGGIIIDSVSPEKVSFFKDGIIYEVSVNKKVTKRVKAETKKHVVHIKTEVIAK